MKRAQDLYEVGQASSVAQAFEKLYSRRGAAERDLVKRGPPPRSAITDDVDAPFDDDLGVYQDEFEGPTSATTSTRWPRGRPGSGAR